MKIDTAIRHVTPPGANIFLELGFLRQKRGACTPPRDARSLKHCA